MILLAGKSWMTWCYYGSVIVCFFMLTKFKEKYYRLSVDQSPVTAADDSHSQTPNFCVNVNNCDASEKQDECA